MKILIVDDEPLARERLKDLLLEIDAGEQLLEADNGLAALAQVERAAPDVILLDIRMPVMDGLETAYHLAMLDHPPAVIFTTAFQDHAFQAFEVRAVDYLMKPIRRDRLESALRRARLITRATVAALRAEAPGPAERSHLSASNFGKIELIPIAAIRYLRAELKYVSVGWSGKETLIDESLRSLEQEFPDRFLRIHRNALIAPQYIQALKKGRDGGHLLYLKDVTQGLPVSRRHLHALRLLLKHPPSTHEAT
jgi:two-component system response regulator AlgR